MGFNLPVLNRRRRLLGTATFSPSALFALAEPGVWYDPSDVANLNWRRNLLTFTEQFDNAVWTKGVGATVSANTSSTTDPIGGNTADVLSETSATNFHFLSLLTAISFAATQYTFTAYLKEGSSRYGGIHINDGTARGCSIDLQTGTLGTPYGSATASREALPNGWYKLTVTATASATASGQVAIYISNSNSLASYAGNTANNIYIWGAQLELGSTVTDYQRISDVNTEVIERFPTATLYQDTAGTTPVTTPGQTVALALDKSKGLVVDTTNKVTENISAAAWTKDSLDVTGSQLAPDGTSTAFNVVPVAVSSDHRIRQSGTYVQGQHYAFSVYAKANGYNFIRLVGTSGGSSAVVFNVSTGVIVSGANGTIAPAGNGYFKCTFRFFQSAADATSAFNNQIAISPDGTTFAFTGNGTSGVLLWKPELLFYFGLGAHATQATLASRPTYGIVPLGGRRNLLERTEEFDSAAWSRGNLITTGMANVAIAPDGTTTADKLIPDTASNTKFANGSPNYTALTGQAVTYSCYVKPDGYSKIALRESAVTGAYAAFDLSTGLLIETGNAGSIVVSNATITSVGSGWFRIAMTCTNASGAQNNRFGAWPLSPSYTTGQPQGQSWAGNGTSGILIWGAQLETGSTATAYQRVGSAFDVTEAGVASLSYLSFDGVDDFLQTPTITPGIDKAQVFAGVRKLSDPDDAILAELGTGSQNGSFYLGAPVNAKTWRYSLQSRGTTGVNANVTAAGFAAPVITVVSGLADISGDVATIRANGVQQAQVTTDQGAGNFLAYPLYIGRRAGTSLPFNGQIYSLIVRFGTNLDAGTITSTETWVAGKTGVTL